MSHSLHYTTLLVGAAWAASLLGGAENAVAPLKCLFDGVNYFHRWTQKDQHEFTPAGQENLTRWTDMVTVNLHRHVHDENGLAGVANGVLGNYERARAKILGTASKPKTEQAPAEHIIVAIFAQPTFIEIAFARVKLIQDTGCVLVYSHREYGEEIGDRVSTWLQAHGPKLEEKWMAWDEFPRPVALAELPETRFATP